MATFSINAATRDAALTEMRAGELDVLVVGGGIVGTGAALDAATRGLSVGLLEARDIASGTSGLSSKLVHGGIRYLEQLDFRLVREALTERGLLLQDIAPHLVTPIRFLYPVHHHVWERAYIGAGMMLYDGISYTGGRLPGVPHHRHLSKRQVMMAAPGLAENATVGGMTYYDGHVDDARYTATLARTAARYGARIATRVVVQSLIYDGERVIGVNARDNMTNESFEVRAKRVVVATGVWTKHMQELIGEQDLHVRVSKGVHILVEKSKFRSLMGLLLRTEKSVLFVIPWGRFWIIGTTDTDWNLDLAHPVATRADIDYILDHINAVVAEPLTHDDIVGVYAGLRPLLAGDNDESSKLSREHIVATPRPGVAVIAGGKWTTYRIMARDVVDAAVAATDGSPTLGEVPESVTQHIPLLGAEGYAAAVNARSDFAARAGLTLKQVDHLLGRYGTDTETLVEMIEAEPSLASRLPGTRDYLEAEVVFAARHELALHVDDVLARRTRLVFESRDRGAQAAQRVAELMAPELGWDAARIAQEVADYTARATAQLAAEHSANDDEAEAAWHLVADDIVGLDGFE